MAKILHVEDYDSFRVFVGRVLRDEGHQVVQVSDGRAGIRALEEGFSPELVVTDLRMPLASGYEVIDALGRLHRSCPVIVHSNSPYDHSRVRYTGRVFYVPKSSRLPVLRESLALALSP